MTTSLTGVHQLFEPVVKSRAQSEGTSPETSPSTTCPLLVTMGGIGLTMGISQGLLPSGSKRVMSPPVVVTVTMPPFDGNAALGADWVLVPAPIGCFHW